VGWSLARHAVLVSGALCAILGGCSSRPVYYSQPVSYTPPSASYAPAAVSAPKLAPTLPAPVSRVYRIGPGDELEIKFFFSPEMNDRMTVRPDGKISMPFAQDIQAAGLTAAQLGESLRSVLSGRVQPSDPVVVVRNFASCKAYVAGEVAKPGPVSLIGNETLLQVLSSAGWTTITAGSDKVVVVRRDPAGVERAYPINVDELVSGVNMERNIIVQSGDLILVPPSTIASVDRWVDQYIRSLLPFSTYAGASYNYNYDAPQGRW